VTHFNNLEPQTCIAATYIDIYSCNIHLHTFLQCICIYAFHADMTHSYNLAYTSAFLQRIYTYIPATYVYMYSCNVHTHTFLQRMYTCIHSTWIVPIIQQHTRAFLQRTYTYIPATYVYIHSLDMDHPDNPATQTCIPATYICIHSWNVCIHTFPRHGSFL